MRSYGTDTGVRGAYAVHADEAGHAETPEFNPTDPLDGPYGRGALAGIKEGRQLDDGKLAGHPGYRVDGNIGGVAW